MSFRRFDYSSIESVCSEAEKLDLGLCFSDRIELLGKKPVIDGFTMPNSLAVHPMEGCDGKPDGSPDELTVRRYERFGKGGAGLLWFEAVAVVPEGRVCPRQLWINRQNVHTFREIFNNIMGTARREFGNNFTPVCIMQLTHSGRFSKPEGIPAPVIASRNPYLDERFKIDENYPVISDEELERLEDRFVEAAELAKAAGFHGVDVKCCHRYLNSELLSAFTRKGKYGETFEGRTRFLLNVIGKIKSKLGNGFIVTARINIYDGIPHPYGWGVDTGNYLKYDMEEPVRLVRTLYGIGVRIVNLTMGTPYYNPHVNRPYDKGWYTPEEHPLKGVDRLVSGIGAIQKAVPEIAVVSTGYSWLRHFSPYIAAGSLEKGHATIIGYGREAFAYPDFARDILEKGSMEKEKCCITCGMCTDIMRAGGTAGCVVRDSQVYKPIYRKFCAPGK